LEPRRSRGLWAVAVVTAAVVVGCVSAPPPFDPQAALIAKGRRIFFNETFNGNGRTCGTCHPAENSFTLDPGFIARLPPTDPLFVAEFVPALSQNFEHPRLMRELALIRENLDGFDDEGSVLPARTLEHLMTWGAPLPLDAGRGPDAFDCGKPALNAWLVRHARPAQGSGSAKTCVVLEDERVTGYFSLTVGQIDTLEATDRVRKGMGSYPIPVVILARLAVSLSNQGQGIGIGMLQEAIRRTLAVAEQAGVTALLTHPIDEDAARFCVRFGSEPSPAREQQLLLLLKDARRLLAPPVAAVTQRKP
jgi:CheY-like chemotaxis protein